jgi:hypothetical protein
MVSGLAQIAVKMAVTRCRPKSSGTHGGWETGGVVFVVDDLAAWLVGLLADAGRKKLAALVLGDVQERALQQAAIAAAQDTAYELSPSDSQRAGQIVMVISEVFRASVPDAPLAGVATLVEGLQAGIADQLAVLDDAGLTETWQSSAEVLGVPGTVLADRLTSHLVREIMLRGSRGGPLTPLADQLNHDLTHLQVRRVEVQGQRVENMLAQLAEEVRDALNRPDSGVAAAGWPLDEVTDPFALEVHRPVQPEDPQPGLPALPAYVPREHDTELGSMVRAAAEGSSGIAVLVGGSSTGKTRACWEALQLLRNRPGQGRLWHPIDPSRPEAALRELPGIGPRTVVWLNEAQFYLDVTDGGLGERVAAGLRELLRDPARGPVLVLATLWPQFWDGLTVRPAGGADPHAQARELLAGHDITVPAAFTAAQLQRLSQAGDVWLAQAAAGAQDGQVIQFLAGAPELLARYRNAPPAASALIHAAMDARRLGMRVGLPRAFLEAAAPGYLTGAEWDALGEDWLEQALAYTAVPCKGVRGPLTRSRPHPARSRASGPGSRGSDEQLADGPAGIAGVLLYRLADYLDQHGRYHRKGQFPPAAFWAAAAGHAFPGDQATLGNAADARGLYRDAAQLHKNAAARGNLNAVLYLASTPYSLRTDIRPVRWAVAHVSLDDPAGVAELLGRLALLGRLRRAAAREQVFALLHRDPAAYVSLDDPGMVARLLGMLRAPAVREQAAALLRRDPAAHVSLDDPGMVAVLLDTLREAGAEEQAAALLRRDPAAHVALDDPGGVAALLGMLRGAGAEEQAAALLRRDPAAHVSLDNLRAVAALLGSLGEAGAREQAAALGHRAAAHVSLDDPSAVAALLDSLGEAGAREQAAALGHRAAAHVSLHNPSAVAWLMVRLRVAGAREQAAALGQRAAHAFLDNPSAMAALLDTLRVAGPRQQAAALAQFAAAHVSLDDPGDVAALLGSLREAGAREQAAALLRRDPAAHVFLDDPGGLSALLYSLGELHKLGAAGAWEQAAALLRRGPAAHVSLDDPGMVAALLYSLRAEGAWEQAAALAQRAADHVSFDNPYAVPRLLDSLREAGARDQAAALAGRLPGAGMFELFREQEERRDRFRFGREVDGSPAGPWGWEDLD